MRTPLAVGLLLLNLIGPLSCLGRPVDSPPLEEMWAKADLVAVIQPLATTNASDQLTSAGPKYGPRDPKDYQALNTQCEVVLIMKTSERLKDWHAKAFTLLHFRYAPSFPEFNGGQFIYFDRPPTELNLIVKGDPTHPIAQDDKPAYLAFLTLQRDGRFHPVTGHYDGEPSFRVLATPQGGAIRYAIEDGVQRKQSEAKEGSAERAGAPKAGLQGTSKP